MPYHWTGHIKTQPSIVLEEVQEIGYMAREAVRVESAQTDIEKVSFAKTPSVASHVRTKVQFGDFSANGTSVPLGRTHFEFCLLSNHGDFFAGVGAEEAGDRTEMSASAYDNFGADLAIHDPRFL
jgi:hypothetical protein